MVGPGVGYRHSARFVRPFAKVLRNYASVPRRDVEALEAIELDAWITYAASAEFVDHAVAITQDADIGLHAAEAVEPGDFDVVEYAARSGETVGEAVDVVNRYIGLLREGANFHLAQDGPTCRWNLDMAARFPRAINDWTVAIYVIMARRLTGTDWRPLEVHLMHDEPSDTREYSRILGAPVKFGQAHNALVFDRSWLDTPIVEADQRLHGLMRRYAGELLQQRPRTEGFVDRVRAAMAESLRAGHVSTLRVAKRLHLSERTLRRRLQEEGTNFKTTLEGVRRELALNYLQYQHELSIAEIAFMLGFSQTPAFSRAFKRWLGCSPNEYREQSKLRRVS